MKTRRVVFIFCPFANLNEMIFFCYKTIFEHVFSFNSWCAGWTGEEEEKWSTSHTRTSEINSVVIRRLYIELFYFFLHFSARSLEARVKCRWPKAKTSSKLRRFQFLLPACATRCYSFSRLFVSFKNYMQKDVFCSSAGSERCFDVEAFWKKFEGMLKQFYMKMFKKVSFIIGSWIRLTFSQFP